MESVRLTCQPNKEGKHLVFPYQVENAGSADIFVMEALPSIDPASGKARANEHGCTVQLGPGDNAILGKYLAPLPTDRRIALPVIPLARRVAPGETISSRLMVPLPLAETSPYFGDLPLRQYDQVDIKGAIFTIGYWIGGLDGLAALPVEYAPELCQIVTRNTARSARTATLRFPATGLQLFKRRDNFPRAAGAPPEAVVEDDAMATRVRSAARSR